jgi:hypothetical protein
VAVAAPRFGFGARFLAATARPVLSPSRASTGRSAENSYGMSPTTVASNLTVSVPARRGIRFLGRPAVAGELAGQAWRGTAAPVNTAMPPVTPAKAIAIRRLLFTVP